MRGCEINPLPLVLCYQMSTRLKAVAAPRDAGQPSIISSLEPSKSALIDEWGRLDTELASLKPKIQRHQELRETILGWHADLAGEKDVTESGEYFDVLIGARDKQRVITMAGKKKLFKLWRVGEFLARCSIALKNLPDPKDAGNLYTVQERTGPRHLKAIPRLAQAA